jgi:DNA polymerase-3 subunit beta
MEFVIDRNSLVRELQTITGVVEKRATIPILANLLLEAKDESLFVGASDLEVTIRGKARASVVREGSVTLPASKLHEIARSLPEADVQFKLLERNQVSITCERTRYRIAGQARDEFPSFPEVDERLGVRLPASMLHAMIRRVEFSITTEDPRYSLNGALFLLQDGKLTLVATDGHRLAYASQALDVARAPEGLKVIVPRKALSQVSRLTEGLGREDDVVFGRAENHIFFLVGEHKLTSNLLEGNYPRYENVMPTSCETSLTLPTESFAQAVRRVSLLANERYGKAVRLSLAPGKLELFSRTEMGEAQESLVVDYRGTEMSIGFNASYLIEFLTVVDSPSVKLELNPTRAGDGEQSAEPGDKPGQLRPADANGLDYRYIVMPMHL